MQGIGVVFGARFDWILAMGFDREKWWMEQTNGFRGRRKRKNGWIGKNLGAWCNLNSECVVRTHLCRFWIGFYRAKISSPKNFRSRFWNAVVSSSLYYFCMQRSNTIDWTSSVRLSCSMADSLSSAVDLGQQWWHERSIHIRPAQAYVLLQTNRHCDGMKYFY